MKKDDALDKLREKIRSLHIQNEARKKEITDLKHKNAGLIAVRNNQPIPVVQAPKVTITKKTVDVQPTLSQTSRWNRMLEKLTTRLRTEETKCKKLADENKSLRRKMNEKQVSEKDSPQENTYKSSQPPETSQEILKEKIKELQQNVDILSTRLSSMRIIKKISFP